MERRSAARLGRRLDSAARLGGSALRLGAARWLGRRRRLCSAAPRGSAAPLRGRRPDSAARCGVPRRLGRSARGLGGAARCGGSSARWRGGVVACRRGGSAARRGGEAAWRRGGVAARRRGGAARLARWRGGATRWRWRWSGGAAVRRLVVGARGPGRRAAAAGGSTTRGGEGGWGRVSRLSQQGEEKFRKRTNKHPDTLQKQTSGSVHRIWRYRCVVRKQ